MIVRILGEGQWRVAPEAMQSLNELDDRVADALQKDDQEALQSSLALLLEQVRAGAPVADDDLVESDLIIPDSSASLDEVRAFLEEQGNGEGLIPG
ncbi:PspA-associated protein PspAA [Luteococcus japonicus]|uniref:PspA-associated domain-containing protein n=1 Tax=Luteococcus japonicus LSP_Lj1 TaxID=1255658 RepID=A0A1R4KN52_9ACTN|nr:hypothetical protein [Luteococcus japonicus]SJN45607.1 hypothetical protein FM114_16160 [Luteococcus japonicus LSP_Lj1]